MLYDTQSREYRPCIVSIASGSADMFCIAFEVRQRFEHILCEYSLLCCTGFDIKTIPSITDTQNVNRTSLLFYSDILFTYLNLYLQIVRTVSSWR